MQWVKLLKYCELSGDTKHAVYSRRKRGHWIDGIHCRVRGGIIWINLKAVEAWIEAQ